MKKIGVVGCGLMGAGIAEVCARASLDVVVVAPAALASTFLTSLVGVMTYVVLAAGGASGARPDWATGVLLGVAGLLGGYLGAGLQGRLPVSLLRRLLGALALALAVGYVVTALG